MNLRTVFSYLGKVFLLCLIYFITAKLGLRLGAVSGFATLFWLPTGISLVILFLFGFRFWPGVAIGAFLANSATGAPLPVALGIAVGNTLEAVIGVYLLRRFIQFQPSLERLRDVLGLILLAAVLSTLISATIGTSSLLFGGMLSTSYLATWSAWWVGDMLSNLITAPFLFVWSKLAPVTLKPKRAGELVLLSLTVIITGVIVFRGIFGIAVTTSPLTYIVFPPLIWAAIRFGQKETVTAIFVLSLFALLSTIQGFGPFARESLSESLLYLQSFMAITASTSMLLAAAVAERRTMEKRKDDFISFASHELKTPLTTIKVFTQLIQRSLDKTGEKHAISSLERLNQQVDKLIFLVNDMLDVAKIQTGKLELHKERFLLQSLIEEVVKTMQASGKKQKIVLKGNVDADIVADKERIEQVLINLLSNAIKYSPNHKAIVVSINRQDGMASVSVKDNGIGISKDQQAKIFDRFYRVSDARSQTTPGLGIGLYLANMIIRRHGGEMWVESTIGKGSTFSFSLPLS